VRSFRVLVVVLVCLVATGCSRAPQPTPLLDGTMSYQSFSQIKLLPKLKNAKWKVVGNSSLSQGDKRPRFDDLMVETPKYAHLNFNGKATFRFYNGRLMQTWFSPSNLSGYKNALSKSLGIAFNSSNDAHLSNTEIHLEKDYVVWSDEVLAEENKKWIEQYS
jgi:hypothetical protein